MNEQSNFGIIVAKSASFYAMKIKVQNQLDFLIHVYFRLRMRVAKRKEKGNEFRQVRLKVSTCS